MDPRYTFGRKKGRNDLCFNSYIECVNVYTKAIRCMFVSYPLRNGWTDWAEILWVASHWSNSIGYIFFILLIEKWRKYNILNLEGRCPYQTPKVPKPLEASIKRLVNVIVVVKLIVTNNEKFNLETYSIHGQIMSEKLRQFKMCQI